MDREVGSSLFASTVVLCSRDLACDRIHYSERYSDEEYEYRHVILPKPLFKMIPKTFFNADNSGTLRLLEEKEWRGIGITQSLGWEHYEVHGALVVLLLRGDSCPYKSTMRTAPEPHVLLFRRPKNFDQLLKRQELEQQAQAGNTRSKSGTLGMRRK